MSVKRPSDIPGSRLVAAILALLCAGTGATQGRQLTVQDYARAERFMPYNTERLVDHDVQRVHWLDERRFWYVDHDSGGDHYLAMTVPRGRAVLLFDQQELAAALGKAIGKSVDDVPAGIAEWAKHKANIGPWNQSPAHTNDLVESGEIWLAFGFGGIAAGAIANGKKIAYTTPSEGATQVADVVHAIKGFNDKTAALTQRALGLFLDDVAQLTFTRNVFTSPISSTAKIPADLAANPALLSPEQVAALHRPDLELSAKKFGEYRNLANQQLKS